MRVTLDGRTIHDHFPGIGRYAYNLALALAQARSSLELSLLHDPRQPNTRYDLARLAEAGVRLEPVAARNFSPAEQWRVPVELRRLQTEVYHSPYYIMPYRPGCPTVLTLHDLIPLHAQPTRPGADLAFDVSVRMAVAAAAHIIAVSQAGAEDIRQRLNVPAGQITTIPEAADPQFSPQSAEAIAAVRRRLALPPRYGLYFGSNKPHKNLARLVTAYTALEGADYTPLVIAGHWDVRYPEARQRAAAWPGRVHLIGAVAQAEVAALYAGAEFFVFPSLDEGFGLPVLEAMACGTPVLCADIPVLREVGGSAAHYFDPQQPEDIMDALRQALTQPELLADLRGRGLERAREFSWARTAQATLAVYQSVRAAPR